MRSTFKVLLMLLLLSVPGCGSVAPHSLSFTAQTLAALPSPDYENRQFRWSGTMQAACNYFVVTAICEAGGCASGVPRVDADHFDTYLRNQGWREVSLSELKKIMVSAPGTNMILQRDGNPGHVSIPVSLSGVEIVVAQGELGGATHELKKVSEAYLSSEGFRAWVSP